MKAELPLWAVLLFLGTVLAIAASIVCWWIWMRVRRRRALTDYDYETIQGLRVYTRRWNPRGPVSSPPPTKQLMEEYLEVRTHRIRAWAFSRGIKISFGALSLVGVRLSWETAKRCSKKAGTIVLDPTGDRLYFHDATDRPAYRNHDWYAGRRDGNFLQVAWTGNLVRSAAMHEAGHLLRERLGLDADAVHADKEFWKLVSY